MTLTSKLSPRTAAPSGRRTNSTRVFTVLTGLAALTVLVQGLWAGLFIHEGQDYQPFWVEVHSRAAEAAIVLAGLAALLALLRLRSRPALTTGAVVFTLLLIAEAYLGGLIGDTPTLTAVHIPLALFLMALGIWLPLHATYRPTHPPGRQP